MTAVALNIDDVELEYMDSVWVGEVGVGTVVVEPGDTSAEVEIGRLSLRLTDEEYAVARQSGFEIFRLRSYGVDAGWLRVVVRDSTSGAAGSLWVTLDRR